jgi:hypothetical protein
MIRKTNFTNARHAELVSASIVQLWLSLADKWTLKQVQGDGVSC